MGSKYFTIMCPYIKYFNYGQTYVKFCTYHGDKVK